MKAMMYFLGVFLFLLVLTFSCKKKMYYECKCYREGIYTNSYEIGPVDDEHIEERCYAVQQQNGEDSCNGSGLRR